MCGIAGILFADPRRMPDRGELAAMAARLAHRGPDGEGVHLEPGVGMAHRRLATLDLAGGQQPIGNEDGSVRVVCNGEIYNHADLHRELVARGHRLRTRGDTEVIVHLYEELGEGLVERLRGMFAFALWDRRRRRLLLARDRLGIKPLYYLRDARQLRFASELKAILADRAVERTVEPAALDDYLAHGMISGPRTIFASILKLQPGHILSVEEGDWNAAPRRYWRLRFDPDEATSAEQWQEAIRAKIQESVRLHGVADVPIGALLSGGLDSSVVVAEAVAAGGAPLQTFTIGFAAPSSSELVPAGHVAQHLGTSHREETATATAGELLDELVEAFDEPLADSSALPTLLLGRLASRSVKVALSGDGGDEAFGGYQRYAHDLREGRVRRWLPEGLRRRLLAPLARAWPEADWLPRPLRAKTALTNLSLDAADAYANTLSLCRPDLRERLIHPDLKVRANGGHSSPAIHEAFRGGAPGDPLSAMLAADIATILADDFLVKVDRASMAYGLEVRTPLLDHELLELTARLPSRYKVRGGETKWLLRRAYRGVLPAATLRRAKQGFEAPIDAWLRGPLRERCREVLFGASSGPLAGLVDLGTLRHVYDAHRRGSQRCAAIVWGALVLGSWAHRYLATRSEAAA